MEVANQIHRIEVPMGERFVCLYLLTGDDGHLLVDTGFSDSPDSYILPYLDEHNIDTDSLFYILISHADNDHFGGNGPLRKLLPGSIFLCHALDRSLIEDVERLINERYDEWAGGHNMPLDEGVKDWVRATTAATPIDITLRGGEQLRLSPDWRVDLLHTPGHSRGHMTIYDPDSRTAIISDAALWHAVPDKDGRPILPPTYRYVDSYRATLNRLLHLPISLLLTGHYPILRDQDALDFLHGSLSYLDRVDQALENELQMASNGRTLRQLIETLSPKLGQWPDEAALFLAHPLTGHLERMERHGRIERSVREGTITYQWRR